MKKYYWIAAVALLSLMLGACQSTEAPDINEHQQSVVQPETPAGSSVETEGQEPEILPATQESEALNAEPETQAEPTPVEIRQGLAATDPATVNLANGTPTFVEFFAFW